LCYPTVRARDVVRRRIDLDLDAPVALGLIDRDRFAVPTLKPTIAEAQADVPHAANLYPGRYSAVCPTSYLCRTWTWPDSARRLGECGIAIAALTLGHSNRSVHCGRACASLRRRYRPRARLLDPVDQHRDGRRCEDEPERDGG